MKTGPVSPSSKSKKETQAGNSSKRRIDLSEVKLVAPYGRDPHTLESLTEIARKMGMSKPGLKSIEPAKAEKSAPRRIDLSGVKQVGPYGRDLREVDSLNVTKIGSPKLGTWNIPPKA